MKKIYPVLTAVTIFLLVILTISQGNPDVAQAQKTQDQGFIPQSNGSSSLTPLTADDKSFNTQTNESAPPSSGTAPPSSGTAPQGQWKTYSDAALGVEFQYPPDWEIKEKTNRFEKGPELSIEESNALNSFSVSTADDISGDIFDSEFFATMGQRELTGKPDTRLIEGVSEHAPIDGEEAYSFTYTLESELGLEAVQEPIALIHDDKGYIFAFTGLTTSFDDQENVGMREQLLNSIKFLDGSGSDAIDEDENPVEAEDEGDDESNEDDGNGEGEANLFN